MVSETADLIEVTDIVDAYMSSHGRSSSSCSRKEQQLRLALSSFQLSQLSLRASSPLASFLHDITIVTYYASSSSFILRLSSNYHAAIDPAGDGAASSKTPTGLSRLTHHSDRVDTGQSDWLRQCPWITDAPSAGTE